MAELWTYKLGPLPDLDAIARAPMVYYGALTCWWATSLPYIRTVLGDGPSEVKGIPSDPRGGVLFESNEAAEFVAKARASADHYGEHGIDAFRAAYHGVVQIWVPSKTLWRPTCFVTWRAYNEALFAHAQSRGEPFTMEAGPVERAIRGVP